MKTLLIKNNVTDEVTLARCIQLVVEKLASIGIKMEFETITDNKQLSSLTGVSTDSTGAQIKYTIVNPKDVILSTVGHSADFYCMVYDWSKVSPQPTVCGDNGKYMQIPVQWYTDATVTPVLTYPEVFCQYFLHEMCHTLIPDLTHNFYQNTTYNRGSQTDYFLYLLKTFLKTSPVPQVVSTQSDSFKRAVENVLSYEGGYVFTSQDPGGETNWGISKRAYPTLNIKTLTRDQAIAIYYKDYWLKILGDTMPPYLAFNVFDFAVNGGVGAAIKTLQSALGLVSDGRIGAHTTEAMKIATKAHLESFVALRVQYYASLPTYPTFGKGWVKRTIGTLIKSL